MPPTIREWIISKHIYGNHSNDISQLTHHLLSADQVSSLQLISSCKFNMQKNFKGA